MSLSLAVEEGVRDPADIEIMSLAALLHDVADWKYSGSESEGVTRACEFLTSLNYAHVDRVCSIIDGVGFKNELKRLDQARMAAASARTDETSRERTHIDANDRSELAPHADVLLSIVQDADRLDAMGSIGIARCFTFGGHAKRPLYDDAVPVRANLTYDAYRSTSYKSPTINHFHEKLLMLKSMMKTKAGQKRAAKRHQVMVDYLALFEEECKGLA